MTLLETLQALLAVAALAQLAPRSSKDTLNCFTICLVIVYNKDVLAVEGELEALKLEVLLLLLLWASRLILRRR